MNPDSFTPPPQAHTISCRVCYADTDRMGRVYYANYLVYFERARTELLRSAGLPYRDMEKAGAFLPVRRCEIRYLGYAEYDDVLTLATWITRLRHATAVFCSALWRPPEPRLLVFGEVELACVNSDGRPRPLPPEAVTGLERYRV